MRKLITSLRYFACWRSYCDQLRIMLIGRAACLLKNFEGISDLKQWANWNDGWRQNTYEALSSPPHAPRGRIYHLVTTDTKDFLETYKFCLTNFIGDFVHVHCSVIMQSVAQLLSMLTFSYNLQYFLLVQFMLCAKWVCSLYTSACFKISSEISGESNEAQA